MIFQVTNKSLVFFFISSSALSLDAKDIDYLQRNVAIGSKRDIPVRRENARGGGGDYYHKLTPCFRLPESFAFFICFCGF